MVDPGTGSTFKALEVRGSILARAAGVIPHPRSDLIVSVQLTTKGRRLVRQALGITSPARLPVGTLREWHWRALCRAYICGDQGIPYDIDTGDGFGYVSWKTILRLRDYKVRGEEKPLVEENQK